MRSGVPWLACNDAGMALTAKRQRRLITAAIVALVALMALVAAAVVVRTCTGER